jgi:MoaE-MoaD fusion protein
VIVRVLFFGVLKDITGLETEDAEIPPQTTVADLFSRYIQRFETLAGARSSILFARNQEFVTPGTLLSENDEVAFLPPVSGGSGDDRSVLVESRSQEHLFALTRAPIRSQEIAQKLKRPEDGAVVVFEGVVRNNTKGRPTRYLEYECYQGMALRQMERVGLEIAANYAVGRIGMIHRLGRLEIGEASVAIVVTAPHRRPAFEAALESINRLKREVPIWKKEYFEDGCVWVEGEWDENLPGRQGSRQ